MDTTSVAFSISGVFLCIRWYEFTASSIDQIQMIFRFSNTAADISNIHATHDLSPSYCLPRHFRRPLHLLVSPSYLRLKLCLIEFDLLSYLVHGLS